MLDSGFSSHVETAVESKRHEIGQFLTADHVADFMASLFTLNREKLDLLDAGAGAGALTLALVRRICQSRHKLKKIHVTAYELDRSILGRLNKAMAKCERFCEEAGIEFASTIVNDDFIACTIPGLRDDFLAAPLKKYNAAIVNPPYKKIRNDSTERRLLSTAGIETSNLYTAFIAITIRLLEPGGELVAITPRSFCNGPYFKPFREDFLEKLNLRQIHLFKSRNAAFKSEGVLQENIIYHAIRQCGAQGRVILSESSGHPGELMTEYQVDYQSIVSPEDPEKYIHLSMDEAQSAVKRKILNLKSQLPDLGLTVSTGRVVDFRAKEFLRKNAGHGTVPLIYPCHFSGGHVVWPQENTRKHNAIVDCEQTHETLVATGNYVLIRRFSSKEERRRIVACIFDPKHIPGNFIGFENHLNYFHANGQGLDMHLAKGLFAYLNSTVVDQFFRQFSGHTQVNATDLRKIPYPSKKQLEELGRAISNLNATQPDLDQLVERVIF